MKASVIVVTYNRYRSLKRTLQSVSNLDFSYEQFEVIVVDNNSNDDTPNVVHQFHNAGIVLRYVKEPRLSFTVGRNTGVAAANSEILLYIDDDATVERGWLRTVVEAFQKDSKVGMVGGPIRPAFEVDPPDWVLKMNPQWLSLFDCGNEVKEVLAVPGPNLCVRKSVMDEVGGFPPDTIGVELEGKAGTFEKIYIGPGDWGLSQKVRRAGYKILYVPDAVVYHHIPPLRITKCWWHSRFAGEACYLSITHQHEHREKSVKLVLKSVRSLIQAVKSALYWMVALLRGKFKEQHEFQISFYLFQAKTEFALARHPDLADRLWKIGLSGILPDDYKDLLRLVP